MSVCFAITKTKRELIQPFVSQFLHLKNGDYHGFGLYVQIYGNIKVHMM